MKKLIYNENTKIIDIIECDEMAESKSKKAKEKEKAKSQGILKKVNKFLKSKIEKKGESLKKNKIFFEIFSYVFVGVMGIVISFVGWKTNERSAEIYQKQLEILDNDREPYFTIKSEKFLGVPYGELNNYSIRYDIKNEGGLMLNPRILGLVKYITIYFNKSGDKYKFNIDNYLAFSEPYYNSENDTIDCFEYRSVEYDNFIDELIEEIKAHFGSVSVSENNYINIYYVNYKNKQRFYNFEFNENEIKISNDKKEGIYIGSNWEHDIQLIIEDIKKGIEEAKKNN